MQIIVTINNVGIKKRRCECKELIGKEICDKGFIWNPGKCDCKCDLGEYLHYEHFKCRKKLVY